MANSGFTGSLQKQSGIALISVLMVFALCAFMASQMLKADYFMRKKTGHVLNHAQLYQYALGGETFGRQLLFDDFKKDQSKESSYDSYDEDWGNSAKSFEFREGRLTIRIRDMQGRFHINQLSGNSKTSKNLVDGSEFAPETLALSDNSVNPTSTQQPSEGKPGQPQPLNAEQRWRRLLSLLGIQEDLTLALVDWLDKDQTPKGLNTEDQGYLRNEPGYRTANAAMVDLSELRLLQKGSLKAVQCLSEQAVVLPAQTKGMALNINTAPALVISSLDPKISPSDAEAIVLKREQTPFGDVRTFLQLPELSGVPVTESQLGVSSQYFEIESHAEFRGQHFYMRSLVHRHPEDGAIEVISRRLGRSFMPAKHSEDDTATADLTSRCSSNA